MLRGPVRKVARFIYTELKQSPHTFNNATLAGAKKRKKTKNHTAEHHKKNKKTKTKTKKHKKTKKTQKNKKHENKKHNKKQSYGEIYTDKNCPSVLVDITVFVDVCAVE